MSKFEPLVELPPIIPEVLALRVLADVEPRLAASLGLAAHHRAAGFITCTSDDALYVALDEGTKAARVEVAYAKSFYAGAAHASGPLSGEVIGVFGAADVEEVRAALAATVRCLAESAWFYAADETSRLALFPHVVTATGSYLARLADVPVGAPLAYLIAPPVEALIGLDAALKVDGVELKKFFGPPTETNFAGAYLTGSLSACQSAARAFAAAVCDVARAPQSLERQTRGAGEMLPSRTPASTEGKYRVLGTGERLTSKPEFLTQLVDDQSLVSKRHPRLVLRGKLDTLQGLLLDAQCAADADGASGLVGELGEALELSRALVGAEVTGQPLAAWTLLGLAPAELRTASHKTWELYGVPFMFPSVRQGPVVARLATVRAYAREAELAAYTAFPTEEARVDLKLALNRLSSALYVMQCKYVGDRYPGEHRRPGPVRGWKPPAKPVERKA